MIFVDANVFMYVVGQPHPLQEEARQFLRAAWLSGARLCTSAEVVQEFAHAYLSTNRAQYYDAALNLLEEANVTVWPLEFADLLEVRELHRRHPTLQARDLCHLASCRRRGVTDIKTFDGAFAAVVGEPTL